MKSKSYHILKLDHYSKKSAIDYANYNKFYPCIVQSIKNTVVLSEIISFLKIYKNDMLSCHNYCINNDKNNSRVKMYMIINNYTTGIDEASIFVRKMIYASKHIQKLMRISKPKF